MKWVEGGDSAPFVTRYPACEAHTGQSSDCDGIFHSNFYWLSLGVRALVSRLWENDFPSSHEKQGKTGLGLRCIAKLRFGVTE